MHKYITSVSYTLHSKLRELPLADPYAYAWNQKIPADRWHGRPNNSARQIRSRKTAIFCRENAMWQSPTQTQDVKEDRRRQTQTTMDCQHDIFVVPLQDIYSAQANILLNVIISE